MLIDILEFNKVRNKFDFDMALEVNMLKEEVQEFFDAKTLAEMIDAVIDVDYVWQGTKMKMAYNGYTVSEELEKWIQQSGELMLEILGEVMIEEGYEFEDLNTALEKAKHIVAEINAKKISKLDENGKVCKQENLENATLVIAKMLKELKND